MWGNSFLEKSGSPTPLPKKIKTKRSPTIPAGVNKCVAGF